MEVLKQLREELKEVINRRKTLIDELKKMNFLINVFRKEVSLRKLEVPSFPKRA
ncbi:MAG TPA: hypothetical protein VJ208_03205 [Candidatus Nanoarchaeia archaeon]|nr:hypothetical protein [Candidatus Nanoarchaeia archaeon]